MLQTIKNKDIGRPNYTRRDFIKAMALGTAGFALGTGDGLAESSVAGKTRRPNLLFIFADLTSTNWPRKR